jgi:hypothetical protein
MEDDARRVDDRGSASMHVVKASDDLASQLIERSGSAAPSQSISLLGENGARRIGENGSVTRARDRPRGCQQPLDAGWPDVLPAYHSATLSD